VDKVLKSVWQRRVFSNTISSCSNQAIAPGNKVIDYHQLSTILGEFSWTCTTSPVKAIWQFLGLVCHSRSVVRYYVLQRVKNCPILRNSFLTRLEIMLRSTVDGIHRRSKLRTATISQVFCGQCLRFLETWWNERQWSIFQQEFYFGYNGL
jgi:hypothetical protein